MATLPGSINWKNKVWYVGTLEDVGIKPHRLVYSSAAVLLTKQVQWQTHWCQRLKIQLNACRMMLGIIIFHCRGERWHAYSVILLQRPANLKSINRILFNIVFILIHEPELWVLCDCRTFSWGQHRIQPLVQSVITVLVRRVGHDRDWLFPGCAITLQSDISLQDHGVTWGGELRWYNHFKSHISCCS